MIFYQISTEFGQWLFNESRDGSPCLTGKNLQNFVLAFACSGYESQQGVAQQVQVNGCLIFYSGHDLPILLPIIRLMPAPR